MPPVGAWRPFFLAVGAVATEVARAAPLIASLNLKETKPMLRTQSRRSFRRIPAAAVILTGMVCTCLGDASLAHAITLYSDVVNAQSPLAFYHLDETSGTAAVDSITSPANDGTYGSAITLGIDGPRPDDFGGFASTNNGIDGVVSNFNSVVSLPTALGMTSDIGSASLWFRATAAEMTGVNSGGGMLFYGTATSGDGFGGQNELHTHLRPDGNVGMFIRGSGGNTQLSTVSSGQNFLDGAWHHAAFTWERDDAGDDAARLYIDGTELLTTTHNANSFALSSQLTLGRPADNNANGNARTFPGQLDEAALFTDVLTDVEVRDQYSAGANHYTGSDFVYHAGAGGQIVGEAEVFSAREAATASSTDNWDIVPGESAGFPGEFANFRGDGYVQAQPDVVGGGNGPDSVPNGPAAIDYTFTVTQADTYQVYVRTVGHDGNSDSVYVTIPELQDGLGGSVNDWYRVLSGSSDDFATVPWRGTGLAETTGAGGGTPDSLTWSLTPGDYTLRFVPREDGVAVDAWVIQPSSAAAPTGIGPPPTLFRIEIEAEAFTSRTGAGGKDWLVVPTEDAGAGGPFAGAQGGEYMQILPDSGGGPGNPLDGPFLDFEVEIPAPGRYLLSARWDGHGTTSDSLYATIVELQDGVGSGEADWYRLSHSGSADFDVVPWDSVGEFEGTSASGNNVPMVWNVATPGVYTIRFDQREDGAALDAFRLAFVVPEPASAVVWVMLGVGTLVPRRRRIRRGK